MPFVIKTRNVGTATILELGARLTAAEGSELKGNRRWIAGRGEDGHFAGLRPDEIHRQPRNRCISADLGLSG